MGYWNDGRSTHNQPRVLHDIDDIVLLVSAVYVCEEQHRMIAHDQRIMNQLPDNRVFPFVLLHQTGFTMRFVELVQSLCQSGMNFHSLEGVISNMRWKQYEAKRQLYQTYIKMRDSQQSYELPPTFEASTNYKFLPSDDIISKCFVAKFLEDENSYKAEIQSTDTGALTTLSKLLLTLAFCEMIKNGSANMTAYF